MVKAPAACRAQSVPMDEAQVLGEELTRQTSFSIPALLLGDTAGPLPASRGGSSQGLVFGDTGPSAFLPG